MNAIEKGLKSVALVLAVIGGALIAMVMLAIVLDVVLRQLWNKPLPELIALSEVSLVVIVYCGLAYAYVTNRHVSADFLRSRVRGASASVLGILRALASAVISVWIFVGCWEATISSHDFDERHRTWFDLALWPVRWFITMAVGLMALLIIANLLALLRRARSAELTEDDIDKRAEGAPL